MVGRWFISFWGPTYFQVLMFCFRECSFNIPMQTATPPEKQTTPEADVATTSPCTATSPDGIRHVTWWWWWWDDLRSMNLHVFFCLFQVKIRCEEMATENGNPILPSCRWVWLSCGLNVWKDLYYIGLGGHMSINYMKKNGPKIPSQKPVSCEFTLS